LVKTVQLITNELIEYLKKHPKALYTIRPRQFEELIAEILASFGWQVKLTPQTRDGGYDIYAINKGDSSELRNSWIIECKKNSAKNKVGLDIVRKLYGLRTEMNVGGALLATTSYFSEDAKAYKASRYDLKLRDYESILEWINQYRPNPKGKLYLKDNRLIVPSED
jgi:restriction endonuclease Mrr